MVKDIKIDILAIDNMVTITKIKGRNVTRVINKVRSKGD